MKIISPLFFAALLVSCSPAINNTPSAGIQGQVLRGPITPVCRENEPCEAPFSAEFIVLKDAREVKRFQSDKQGEFVVALAPGIYTIVPDSTAPLITPQIQQKTLEVQPQGMTQVTLHFDTGIR